MRLAAKVAMGPVRRAQRGHLPLAGLDAQRQGAHRPPALNLHAAANRAQQHLEHRRQPHRFGQLVDQPGPAVEDRRVAEVPESRPHRRGHDAQQPQARLLRRGGQRLAHRLIEPRLQPRLEEQRRHVTQLEGLHAETQQLLGQLRPGGQQLGLRLPAEHALQRLHVMSGDVVLEWLEQLVLLGLGVAADVLDVFVEDVLVAQGLRFLLHALGQGGRRNSGGQVSSTSRRISVLSVEMKARFSLWWLRRLWWLELRDWASLEDWASGGAGCPPSSRPMSSTRLT